VIPNVSTARKDSLIRTLIDANPEMMPVLAAFGLDLCCGGGHTLEDACAMHELDLATVLDELESIAPLAGINS
jgi:iron-sulfur cluster repair protein YtfE (RIC family)